MKHLTRRIILTGFMGLAMIFMIILSNLINPVKTTAQVKDKTRPSRARSVVYDVRAFGARGDGRTLDTRAINKAIETAAAAGGGTVNFLAGTYLSVSIRLRSNITLQFDHGATFLPPN